jgi:bifunctional DNase/RNase
MKMTEMRIGAIGIDKDSGQSVVLLRDSENRRALPIWVGLAEVRAISNAVRNVITLRPSTHELLYTTIKQLGHEIKQVTIASIKGDTFLAEIVLRKSGSDAATEMPTTTLDARPSDAIALAAMCNVPVFVATDLLVKQGVSANPERDHKEAAEFRDFVENVKASDFNLVVKGDKVELPGDDFEVEL